MHIGFLTVEFAGASTPQGGLGVYSRRLAEGLAERGHQVTIVTVSDRPGRYRHGGIQVIERARRKVPELLRRVKGIWALAPALQDVLTARRLSDTLMREHHRDPVHVVQAANLGAPAVVLSRQPRRPVLITRFSSYTPLLRASNRVVADTSQRLLDMLEMRQAAGSEACVTPSRFVAGWLRGLEQMQVEVVPSPLPVHLERDVSEDLDGRLEGRKYVLFLGTMCLHKGVDVFAAALPTILDRNPHLVVAVAGHDATLFDGTQGSDVLRAACLGREDRLFILGWLPSSRMLPVVRRSLAVVLPSRVDNHPNACLDTMLCSVPAIVSNRSSLDEMIADGRTGFVFENGSAPGLAGAVDRLMSMSDQELTKMHHAIALEVDAMRRQDRVGLHERLYREVFTGSQPTQRDPGWRVPLPPGRSM